MSSRKGANEWTPLEVLDVDYPDAIPITFGKSIWIATRYYSQGKGLVEYDCSKDRIRQIVPYPHGFEPSQHTACKYKDDTIVIVDGKVGAIITFNVLTYTFTEPVSIPRVGNHCSAIAAGEYIHIFHGQHNSQYIVFSMNNGTVTTFEDDSARIHSVAVTNGPDGAFYKFGGYSSESGAVNPFFIGTLPDDNAAVPIQWTETSKFALKKPLYRCGYVQYESFIVLFGGATGSSDDGTDSVFILDLNDEEESGWKSAAFTCPVKGRYIGTVDYRRNIHLFSYDQEDRAHVAIGLNSLNIEMEEVEYDDDDEDDGVFVIFVFGCGLSV